jgi:hypothetical protein
MEGSALGFFMRESGPWTYPIVNFLHILGISTLFGSVLVLDLALIGAWRKWLPALAASAAPVAAAGFGLAATTGVALLSTNGTEYAGNPFFMIKFPIIAVGFANAVAIRQSAAWRALHGRELTPSEARLLAWMGSVSLVSWIGAIAAGRMIGYW